LLVQGAFCYLIEYFSANYFLNSGYSAANASGSAAPIGDMMVLVGNQLFNGHGRAFMLVEAFTVFLAIIGTTLSCMNTGARVTYAMGKDKELPDSMGALHAGNLTPHRAIWTLAVISAIVGSIAVVMAFGDAGAPQDTAIQALPHGFWSSFGYTTHDKMAALPNSLLTITLASNFGTFLLYMFGLLANLVCMAFYLIGPFMGFGTKMEPLLALGIAAVWGIYGLIYFMRASKATGKTTLVQSRAGAA
jgi:amino acid transporter